MNKHFLYIICLIIIFSACKKQEVGPQCPSCVEEEIIVQLNDVLIGCEGNFGWGNSSISLYNPNDTSVTNSVFQNINGYALGDVLQSTTEYNGKLYLTVNNSGKIEILDTANYVGIGTITGLTSPRYFCGVNTTKAYVSDLYSNQISIIDLSTNSISGTITTNGWTEEMVLSNNKVFVSRPDTNFVLQINATTDVIEDTIVVAKGPSSIVIDNNGMVWALSSGGYSEELAELNQIDPVTNSIVQTLAFNNLSNSPNSLKTNFSGNKLYFLNSDVYQLSINDNTLPSTPFINQNNSTFYGLGISPINEIYVSDAIDYVQPGIVNRFDSTGILIHQFTVGIIPQGFWFK